MSVQDSGKPAITHFQVIKKFDHHSLVKLQLETGRTHQIRVHMAYIKYPLLGDPVYGGRSRLPAGIDPSLAQVVRDFGRQALHAEQLAFIHPRSRQSLDFKVDPPADFRRLVESLETYD